MLGLRELRPLVLEAWQAERLEDWVCPLEYFERDLAEAERAPDDAGRFRREHLGHVEDAADAIAWVDWSAGPDAEDAAEDDDFGDPFPGHAVWGEPAFNPWRDVGRNDPCPCGSGRKFKKCCLGSEGGGGP